MKIANYKSHHRVNSPFHSAKNQGHFRHFSLQKRKEKKCTLTTPPTEVVPTKQNKTMTYWDGGRSTKAMHHRLEGPLPQGRDL